MKIYMICPTLVSNKLTKYRGWTTNEFIKNKYVDFLEEITKSEVSIELYDTIKTCTKEAIDDAFRPELKLKTLKSDTSDNVLVINDIIYDEFIESLVAGDNLNKIRYDIYRLCSNYAVEYLFKYLIGEDREVVIKSIVTMSKYSHYIKELFVNYSLSQILGHSKYDSEIWGILDLYYYLNDYFNKQLNKEKYFLFPTFMRNSVYGMYPENIL